MSFTGAPAAPTKRTPGFGVPHSFMKAIVAFFSLIWRGWKKFAHVLGAINTRILLTVTYFIILSIAFVVAKLTGKDLIDRRMDPKPSYYHPHPHVEADLAAAKRQF